MEYHKKKFLCTNCGKVGHEYRHCNEPITSFGIINIKIEDETNENLIIKDKFSTKKNNYYAIISKKYSDIKCFISDNIKLCDDYQEKYKLIDETIPYSEEEQIRRFCYYRDRIRFMMVSRKFSLGFIEFIRGKYDVTDSNTIINLFQQMYDDEIAFIRKNQYDDILNHFLNRNNEPKEVVLNKIYEGKYSNEYCEAKTKFNILANPSKEDMYEIPCSLNFYTSNIKPRWKKPEWGFPKGRRDKKTEENIDCACREFEEETGYRNSDYIVLNKIEPIEEKMVGTNGVKYRHIYYLAINENNKDVKNTCFDVFEVGEVEWFTYDEAMMIIRPYHMEKKNVLTKIYLFLLNYLIHNIHDI